MSLTVDPELMACRSLKDLQDYLKNQPLTASRVRPLYGTVGGLAEQLEAYRKGERKDAWSEVGLARILIEFENCPRRHHTITTTIYGHSVEDDDERLKKLRLILNDKAGK